MSNKPLYTDNFTEDDITHFAQEDSDNVIYNLLEDIKCLREDREALLNTIEEYNFQNRRSF